MEEALISVLEESVISSHMLNLSSGLELKISYVITRLSFLITSRGGETVNVICAVQSGIMMLHNIKREIQVKNATIKGLFLLNIKCLSIMMLWLADLNLMGKIYETKKVN